MSLEQFLTAAVLFTGCLISLYLWKKISWETNGRDDFIWVVNILAVLFAGVFSYGYLVQQTGSLFLKFLSALGADMLLIILPNVLFIVITIIYDFLLDLDHCYLLKVGQGKRKKQNL